MPSDTQVKQPHESPVEDWPVFWVALFFTAALIGAFGTAEYGSPYAFAAGIAGVAVVDLLRPHIHRRCR